MPRSAAIVLVLLAAATLAQGEEKLLPPPVLVARTDAVFVHAVCTARDSGEVEPWVRRSDGYLLLHTNRKTGEMKHLIPDTGTVAIPTVRQSYVQTRMVGVAADTERLYVLLWTSGRIFDRPPERDAPVEGGRYELRVFWLADGSRIAAPGLDPEKWPKTAPPEVTNAGPLKLAKDGVDCYGVTARYKGKELHQK